MNLTIGYRPSGQFMMGAIGSNRVVEEITDLQKCVNVPFSVSRRFVSEIGWKNPTRIGIGPFRFRVIGYDLKADSYTVSLILRGHRWRAFWFNIRFSWGKFKNRVRRTYRAWEGK